MLSSSGITSAPSRLRVLQPNLAFFADNGCRLMFQQGSGQALSEFVELRSYLIAKLLWNTELDPQEIIKDFLYGYYGAAAPYLGEYIGIMNDELESSGDNLWIYGYPYSAIDTSTSGRTSSLNTGACSTRLKKPRFMNLKFSIGFMQPGFPSISPSWTFPSIMQPGNYHGFRKKMAGMSLSEEMTNLLDTFVSRCDRLNIKMLNEQVARMAVTSTPESEARVIESG